ncbi:MAG TPA: TetR family transcriptional regulator [Alphaproteobacteria bacterium]|nr:TetR family transcriptional regulator [Alphaproteobacteria bacterium]
MTTRRHRRTPRLRKKQQRAEATRLAVLDIALDEFARSGLEGARVDRIAGRAKVNKQAIYYYFGNKEGLFSAALAAVYERIPEIAVPVAEDETTPEASMRALIATLFDHFRGAEQGTAIIAHENRYRGRHLSARVRRQISESVAPIIAAIERALVRGQRDGVFRRDVRVTDLYLTVVALSHFYFAHAYTLSAIVAEDLLAPRAVAAWKRHVGDFVIAALQRRRRAKSTG